MNKEAEEMHSKEVREVLYGRAPFMVRHGMTIMAAVIGAAVAAMVIADWPEGLTDQLLWWLRPAGSGSVAGG
ncbi:MAG: hypothetical protein K2J18_05755 [Paramuribaculum sp.]|nr:hypothetical protein [Paramuribaculum sp.]MDE7471023.1 hypothetical protein [Paramuribaculum sp.]